MISQVFDQLHIGQKTRSPGRTITETDVVHFFMLTGNWLGLHCDVEYAKTTRYGQRVVQGSLVFSISSAQIAFDPEVIEAFYGVDRLRFHKPVFIGDTIKAHAEIIELTERGSENGIVTLLLQAVNQRNEVAMSCRFALVVRRARLVSDTSKSGHIEVKE